MTKKIWNRNHKIIALLLLTWMFLQQYNLSSSASSVSSLFVTRTRRNHNEDVTSSWHGYVHKQSPSHDDDNPFWHHLIHGTRGGETKANGMTLLLLQSYHILMKQLEAFFRTIQNNQRHLIAAAIARSTSIFIMYPIDVMKTKLQLQQSIQWNMNTLFNGITGSLIGQVPYGILTFGSYEMYKQTLLSSTTMQHFPPLCIYALAAILGDLTGSIWLCPSEVVKQQIQAGIHTNTMSAIQNIYQQKGFAGFYQGYVGGLSRDIPFRVAQLTTFEFTKTMFLKYKLKQKKQSKNNKKNELTPVEAAICGAISGTFSAAITSPLDRFKTLLMTSKDPTLYGSNVISCARNVWQKEGIRGFTAGMIPRVIYIAPSVVIFFVAYEMSQQKLKRYYDNDNPEKQS